MVIYFVPVGLIVALLLFVIGAFYSLLKSIMSFVYGLLAAIFIIAGLTVVLFSFFRLFNKNKTNSKDDIVIQGGVLPFVSDFLFGIFIASLLPLIKYWLQIGMGTKAFKNAEYIILGTYEKIDIKTASVIIMLVLVVVVIIPLSIAKTGTTNSKIASPIITLLITTSVFFIGFELSLENKMRNSYDSINWDSAEYEVIADTYIHQSEFIDNVPIITGKFSKGTKLYIIKTEIHTEPNELVLVSDGNEIGLVSVDDTKSLVSYRYFVNTEAQLYAKDENHNWPGGDIIAVVEEGTEVEKINVYQYMATPPSHVKIKLSDGTEGFIEIDKITEIRE